MEKILKLDSVQRYNELRNIKTIHPHITLFDLSKLDLLNEINYNFGVYAIYLKDTKKGELKYGRSLYDFVEDTLVFISPGQIVGIDPEHHSFEAKGWGLLFDPELLTNTYLGKNIDNYSFFSYDVNEALHLSKEEKKIVLDCFDKIQSEILQIGDDQSQTLIVSNLELLLNYCVRFYERQFKSRRKSNQGILQELETLLKNYFNSDKSAMLGLPTVKYCADELNLSSNYFGDLIKKETGKSAQEYIQDILIKVAKERIFDLSKTIAQIADSLGYKHSQHFIRLFKKKVGVTPNEYRNLKI